MIFQLNHTLHPKCKKMDKCSIIIPHFNNESMLSRCLSSIKKYTNLKHEIIVVDNNSSDASIEMVKSRFNFVKIISNDKNLGYAGGCNLGATSAKNNFLIFLNNDTLVSKDWIKPIISILKRNGISSVQPKIKNLNNQNSFDYAGASGGFIDVFCFPFCRGRIFNTIENDYGQYDLSREIFWASGTAFATKKNIFVKSGMFDPKFFVHMEEIDYHWRSQMMGYKIVVCTKSVIYHEGGRTLSYESSLKTYFNHRNSMIIFLSNHNLFTVLLLFIPKIFLHLTSILYDFIFLRIKHSLYQIRALLWVLINIFYILRKRQLNKKISIKNYKLNGMFKISVVINYFIFNKRYFSNY